MSGAELVRGRNVQVQQVLLASWRWRGHDDLHPNETERRLFSDARVRSYVFETQTQMLTCIRVTRTRTNTKIIHLHPPAPTQHLPFVC